VQWHRGVFHKLLGQLEPSVSENFGVGCAMRFQSAVEGPRIKTEKCWAMGALLMLGDELAKPQHRYFDHAPILELVYHLRNGVADSKRFNITPASRNRVVKYEAHNRDALVKSPLGTTYDGRFRNPQQVVGCETWY
jgi:hypothetical protein